jgi:hypothetical protein
LPKEGYTQSFLAEAGIGKERIKMVNVSAVGPVFRQSPNDMKSRYMPVSILNLSVYLKKGQPGLKNALHAGSVCFIITAAYAR